MERAASRVARAYLVRRADARFPALKEAVEEAEAAPSPETWGKVAWQVYQDYLHDWVQLVASTEEFLRSNKERFRAAKSVSALLEDNRWAAAAYDFPVPAYSALTTALNVMLGAAIYLDSGRIFNVPATVKAIDDALEYDRGSAIPAPTFLSEAVAKAKAGFNGRVNRICSAR